jgi:hypothetical protein
VFAYPDGAKALADGLGANKSITMLNLGTNGIGDEGAVALASAIRANDALTNLSLVNNEVTH